MQYDSLQNIQARHFPESAFASPLDLALYPDLTVGQRISLLVAWRGRLQASLDQEESSIETHERNLIVRVDEAIDLLLKYLQSD